MPKAQVEWGPLNPARGEAGPRAANLWGDRTQPGPSGFLVAFRDGFSSPPHIHNVTYRGIVIEGQVHNDDPDAEHQWLPPGSYWTQPKGGVHITAAQGSSNLAYIEIEDGPYLVHPPEDAFHAGEVPINVDPSHHVWLDAADLAWNEDAGDSGAQRAFLWGQPGSGESHGGLVRLPQEFIGTLQVDEGTLQGVVIAGRIESRGESPGQGVLLDAGSALRTTQGRSMPLRVVPGAQAVLYVRTAGTLRILPEQP